MKNSFLILLTVLLFVGCEETSAPSPATVYASVDGRKLDILNATSSDVYYFIFESQRAAFTDWIPICSESNKINPSSRKSIEFNDSTFFPSNQAIVYWWFKGPKYNSGEAYGADSLRSIVVSIK